MAQANGFGFKKGTSPRGTRMDPSTASGEFLGIPAGAGCYTGRAGGTLLVVFEAPERPDPEDPKKTIPAGFFLVDASAYTGTKFGEVRMHPERQGGGFAVGGFAALFAPPPQAAPGAPAAPPPQALVAEGSGVRFEFAPNGEAFLKFKGDE